MEYEDVVENTDNQHSDDGSDDAPGASEQWRLARSTEMTAVMTVSSRPDPDTPAHTAGRRVRSSRRVRPECLR